jgi:membrane protease YdiL (CAAX protease family)
LQDASSLTATGAAPPPRPRLPFADWPLRRTVWGVVVGLGLGGLFLPIPVLIVDPDLESHWALIAVQAILGATMIMTALVVAGEDGQVRAALGRLGIRRFRPSAFGWMLAAYAGYVAVIALYSAFVVQPDQEDIARDLGLDSETIAAAFSVLLIAFVAPFAEELFFRGMLFGGLRVRMSPLPAALISGAVFGSLHATTGVTAVPPLIVFGVALALLYERTGSLWPAIFLHLLNNSLALALSA